MNAIRFASRLLVAVLAWYAAGVSADQTITFNVPVKLTNLYSDVKTFSVSCNMRNTANPLVSYAHGRKDISVSKTYNGTVAVPVPVPDSIAPQVNAWSCEIALYHSGAGMGCTPTANATVSACKAKAGTQLVTKVQGSL